MFLLPDTTALGHGGDKVLVAGPGKYDSAIIDTTDLGLDRHPRPQRPRHRPAAPVERPLVGHRLARAGPGGRAARRSCCSAAPTRTPRPPVPAAAPPPMADRRGARPGRSRTRAGSIDPALELGTARAHFNTVLLPDGIDLQQRRRLRAAQRHPLRRPGLPRRAATRPASAGATSGDEADARTYHSTSVLLPDGRVASAGDDRDIAPEHIPLGGRTAQLWSPPYLFDGAAPRGHLRPGGGGLRRRLPRRRRRSARPTSTRAVLMRPGAVTHAVDMAQRSIAPRA